MSKPTPEQVMAETKALIEQTQAQIEQTDQLMAQANAEIARALGKDPATFDLENYLRQSVSTAEFDQLMHEARAQLDSVAPASPQAAPTRSAAGRPQRRMV